MKFVLDEDVDARLRKDIEAAGHDCWTIQQSGLSAEQDANVAVYAQRHGAVLVTNDREFSQRAKKRVYGQHIYLNCGDLQAREILNLHLGDLVGMLERHEHLYASVSRERVEFVFANQAWK